jgi:uncharacterized protein involved in exopolysaccharide biosynthesis
MSNASRTIDLADLWALLWKHWLAIFIVTFLATAAAVAIALLIPPVYRAEVIVAPSQERSGGLGGLAGLAGQFGGLASLAGINLPRTDSDESLAILKSRGLATTFIEQNELLPVLFPKIWDAKLARWNTADPESVPTLWSGSKLFQKKVMRVRSDQKTGLVTLSIDWGDPQTAATWANALIRHCNGLIRERALGSAERNIAYLEGQLEKTSLAQVKQAISQLLEVEIKNVMMTKGTEEYAFKVIDAAVPPEERFSPSRKMVVILGFLIGLCGSAVWFFLRDIGIRGTRPAPRPTQ